MLVLKVLRGPSPRFRSPPGRWPLRRGIRGLLATHRACHGEQEQNAHAQRVDPSNAMPATARACHLTCVCQRRYAVRAYIEAGMAPAAIARVLGMSPSVIHGDLKAIAP